MSNKIAPTPALPRPPFSASAVLNYLGVLNNTLVNYLADLARLVNGSLWRDGSYAMTAPLPLATFTVATLPAATTAGELIYVSDESGGAVLAFSDGADWLRVTDRAVVS